jgi:hypothetical protein
MHVLSELLADRDVQSTATQAADDQWLRERAGIDPEERRAAWRRWVCRELEKVLQWPADKAARERLIGQCAAELTTLVRQLHGRGWLLDGAALADHVRACIAPIATAQKKGTVGDFFPYFRAAVRRYVGAHAEAIQAQARRTGADEGAQTMAGALAALGIGTAKPRAKSLTEVIAEREAEARRVRLDQANAENAQQRLF